MIDWAGRNNLLASLGLNNRIPRASIFADDAVLFFTPATSDLQVIEAMLQLFGEASGLKINFAKSSITCIRCEENRAVEIAAFFGCQHTSFPLKYLGLPLSIYRLKRQDILPLIDRFSSKMKGWKPKLVAPTGRLALTSSVLMALPIHFLSVFPLPVC